MVSMHECYALRAVKNIQNQIELKHINHKLMLGKFNILYLNINGIAHKIDDIELNLFNILDKHKNQNIHCIALTEVRIHDFKTKFFNIPHYISFYCTRSDGYGGVALFVHESIDAHLVETNSNNNIQHLTVNLVQLSVSVAVVYKQPSVSDDVFVDFISSFIENKKNFFIIGDMNINLLNDSLGTKRYIDCIISHGFAILNRINETFSTRSASRINNDFISVSNTIIDHFITDCIPCQNKVTG